MSFEHEAGPPEFGEDTYRTLTAVDNAVMALDAAEPRASLLPLMSIIQADFRA